MEINIGLRVPTFGVLQYCSSGSRERSQVLAPALAAAAILGLGGCAQPVPQRLASTHSKEYFAASIYGPASPRVVAEGEPMPRGGGFYMVGHPYTIAGRTYYPSEKRYAATGFASWYGDAFHGRRTANGEIYDRDAISAAHPTLPLPCYARVTNLRNRYSMIVRVNDRGPYADDRILDVSRKVAETLGFNRIGTTQVRVEYLGAASLAGSDDRKLLATLRSKGPAVFQVGGIGRDRFELAQDGLVPAETGPNERAATDTEGARAGTGPAESRSTSMRSSGQVSVRVANFKGRPVPLPPARPAKLDPGSSTKLALRRTSFGPTE